MWPEIQKIETKYNYMNTYMSARRSTASWQYIIELTSRNTNASHCSLGSSKFLKKLARINIHFTHHSIHSCTVQDTPRFCKYQWLHATKTQSNKKKDAMQMLLRKWNECDLPFLQIQWEVSLQLYHFSFPCRSTL